MRGFLLHRTNKQKTKLEPTTSQRVSGKVSKLCYYHLASASGKCKSYSSARFTREVSLNDFTREELLWGSQPPKKTYKQFSKKHAPFRTVLNQIVIWLTFFWSVVRSCFAKNLEPNNNAIQQDSSCLKHCGYRNRTTNLVANKKYTATINHII